VSGITVDTLSGITPWGFLASLGLLAVAGQVSPAARLLFVDELATPVITTTGESGAEITPDDLNEQYMVVMESFAQEDNRLTNHSRKTPIDPYRTHQRAAWSTEDRPWSALRTVNVCKTKEAGSYANADFVLYGTTTSYRSNARSALLDIKQQKFLPPLEHMLDTVESAGRWRFTPGISGGAGKYGDERMPVAVVLDALAAIGALFYPPVLPQEQKRTTFLWRPWSIPMGLAGTRALLTDEHYLSGAQTPVSAFTVHKAIIVNTKYFSHLSFSVHQEGVSA